MNTTMRKLLMVFAVLTVCTAWRNPYRQTFLGCVDSKQCGVTECCVIDQKRHGYPSCRSLLPMGRPCNPFNTPINSYVNYPEGSIVKVTNVFLNSCRCGFYLVCDKASKTCKMRN